MYEDSNIAIEPQDKKHPERFILVRSEENLFILDDSEQCNCAD